MDNDWKRLKDAYPLDKKVWDHTYPWIAYVARPLSFPISWLCRKTGLTANMVTVFTAVLGIISVPLLASGSDSAMLAGGLCILAYNILDCVDGNLARAWPAGGPPVGKFWDQLVGNFYWLSYLALGIGLGDRTSLLLGALITTEKYAAATVRHIFWNVLGNDWEAVKASPSAGYRPGAGRWHYKLYYSLVDLQGHAFLLPLCVAAQLPGLFLWTGALLAAVELAVNLAIYISRSLRLKS